MTSEPENSCSAALVIRGEFFWCDMMNQMATGSKDHQGWAHGNKAAEAIWKGDDD